MMEFFQNYSQYLGPLGRSVVMIGVAYVIGLAVRDLLVARLVRMASRTPGAWDDILISEVRKRVPFWCLLFGAYLSLGYWTWTKLEKTGLEPGKARAEAILYAFAVASVTLAASNVLT